MTPGAPRPSHDLYTPRNAEELAELLNDAAEIEHLLLCAYLFTVYSLKQSPAEGITPDQAKATNGWRRAITEMATQEMLHLGLVSNLLTAIGRPAHFERPNFPLEQLKYYPPLFRLDLMPFSETALSWYIGVESSHPEKQCPVHAAALTQPDAPARIEHAAWHRKAWRVDTLPRLYEAVARGFVQLGPKVFAGNNVHQMTAGDMTSLFNFPPAKHGAQDVPLLCAVTDVSSALQAIHIILSQGEGDVEAWNVFLRSQGFDPAGFPQIRSPSHEATFLRIRQSYLELCDRDPSFRPARPVALNPRRSNPSGLPDVHIISEPFARHAAELFDVTYGVMIDLVALGFTYQGSKYQIASAIQAAIRGMTHVMSPFANALTQLPAGGGFNAGPGFYLDRIDQSWDAIADRLAILAGHMEFLAGLPAAREVQVYVTPSQLSIKKAQTVSDLLVRSIVPDLRFLSERLRLVRVHLPRTDCEMHVCRGLNGCRGQDVTGTAGMAGTGACATAYPHTCAGQNECKHQGGCGFTPDPDQKPDLQNHPGQNKDKTDSACGSPILPSRENTYGPNTPPEDGRGGVPEIYGSREEGGAGGEGRVWNFARILFEKKMKAARKPYGPCGAFPGWSPDSPESDDDKPKA